MNRRKYISEGEIEENFLKCMVGKNYIKPGRKYVFNLVQRDLMPSNNILQEKNVDFYCIIDTDVWDETLKQRFLRNMKTLSDVGQVFVLVQNQKFEHELAFMIHPAKLYDYFRINERTESGLKKHLMDEEYSKLTKSEYDKYCCRSANFQNEVKDNLNKGVVFVEGKGL